MNNIEEQISELKTELEKLEAQRDWSTHPEFHKYLVDQGFTFVGKIASKEISEEFTLLVQLSFDGLLFSIVTSKYDNPQLYINPSYARNEYQEAIKFLENIELPKKCKLIGTVEYDVYTYDVEKDKKGLLSALDSLDLYSCILNWKDPVVVEEIE